MTLINPPFQSGGSSGNKQVPLSLKTPRLIHLSTPRFKRGVLWNKQVAETYFELHQPLCFA